MGQPDRDWLKSFFGTWLNLRAEAVLYFGEHPYNLRRLNSSCNRDYAGDEGALAAEISQVPAAARVSRRNFAALDFKPLE